MGRPVGPLGGVPAWQPRFQIGLRVHSLLPHPPENNAGRPRPLHVRLTRPYRAPMSLNGMAESRRHWCHRRVWLKCSKPVARQSQVLPVRASRRFKKARKKSGKPKRHRPYSLLRPRAGPSFLFLAARPQPRARGTPGVQKDPRASTPRDIEACRSVCWCRKSAKPKASRARCLRLAPHRPPVVGRSSRSPEEPVRDSPPLKPGHSAGGHADWTTGLPAVRGLGVRDRHAGIMRGLDRRGQAPHLRRLPFPATAPRPASGRR